LTIKKDLRGKIRPGGRTFLPLLYLRYTPTDCESDVIFKGLQVNMLNSSSSSSSQVIASLRKEYKIRTLLSQGFFPGFWEHNPYPWNWEIQQCFVKNWAKMHD
jgi:hypothetical protein